MPFWKKHAHSLALLLVLGIGILLKSPYINFQDYLSQGDHGRDLYAAQAVCRGEIPYRNFWWVYGPLMPYYYGLFFKLFGMTIRSILLGKILLELLCGVLMYLGLAETISPMAALLGACWFMLFHQDFFYTYNHLGGIVMILGVVYCLLSYIKSGSSKVMWAALGFIFMLCLIKINFGLAALAVAVLTIGMSDAARHASANTEKKLFYILALLGLPFLILFIYSVLLHGLSPMEIRQCLPYKEGDQPYSMSPWLAIAQFLKITWHTATSGWNLVFALIINASALRCIYLLVKNKWSAQQRNTWLLSLGMLSLFYLANTHEYLKSGVWYRLFWSQPLSIMMIFLLIGTALQKLNQIVRQMVFVFIAAMLFISWFLIACSVNAQKTPAHFLDLPRGQIYIGNSPSWVGTVENTTGFLNKTIKSNELFFAIPYDCLYYYLTDKKSPTRQLIFFEHIRIPRTQEESIIGELERNHVNYILLSNRAFARQEAGLGFLGKTYCPLIGKYMQDNFMPMARFGDWSHEPGWGWNHGTLILKRKGT